MHAGFSEWVERENCLHFEVSRFSRTLIGAAQGLHDSGQAMPGQVWRSAQSSKQGSPACLRVQEARVQPHLALVELAAKGRDFLPTLVPRGGGLTARLVSTFQA